MSNRGGDIEPGGVEHLAESLDFVAKEANFLSLAGDNVDERLAWGGSL